MEGWYNGKKKIQIKSQPTVDGQLVVIILIILTIMHPDYISFLIHQKAFI